MPDPVADPAVGLPDYPAMRAAVADDLVAAINDGADATAVQAYAAALRDLDALARPFTVRVDRAELRAWAGEISRHRLYSLSERMLTLAGPPATISSPDGA